MSQEWQIYSAVEIFGFKHNMKIYLSLLGNHFKGCCMHLSMDLYLVLDIVVKPLRHKNDMAVYDSFTLSSTVESSVEQISRSYDSIDFCYYMVQK